MAVVRTAGSSGRSVRRNEGPVVRLELPSSWSSAKPRESCGLSWWMSAFLPTTIIPRKEPSLLQINSWWRWSPKWRDDPTSRIVWSEIWSWRNIWLSMMTISKPKFSYRFQKITSRPWATTGGNFSTSLKEEKIEYKSKLCDKTKENLFPSKLYITETDGLNKYIVGIVPYADGGC